MISTLCFNCHNSKTCTWENDNVILCNEYTLQPILEENNKSHNTDISIVNTKKISLCTNCDNALNCTFKHNNLNTIFCEEYQ
jgi:hypothetical protein